MSKKYFQQVFTTMLAALILVVGRGYGSLTHTCEEHGRHSHLIVNTESQACDHESHHQEHEHHEKTEDGYCHSEHESANVQFVSIHAESLVKIQPDFSASWVDCSTSPSIFSPFVFEIIKPWLSSVTEPPFLRRPYGRQLLAWVQSFLI